MRNDKQFELQLRNQIDAKYARPVEGDNPFAQLLLGKLSLTEVRDVYLGMFDSLMVFNRVLLPRLLEKSPDLEARVELMSVIAVEYGPHLEDAHPVLFMDFLEAVGADRAPLMSKVIDLEAPANRAEVEFMQSASWVELLGRILVGESLGPMVFPAISEALATHYGLKGGALAYFDIHSVHDKKDAEVLFDMIRRYAVSDSDKKKVFDIVDRSFDQGRYKQYGCALPGTTAAYSYSRKFDRRSVEGRTLETAS